MLSGPVRLHTVLTQHLREIVQMEFAADFKDYYNNKHLSDVILMLREEEGRESEKGSTDQAQEEETPRSTTLYCHSMVLLAYSDYFKVKFEGWSTFTGSGGDTARHVELTVPAGQLDIAEHFVECLYQKKPATSSLSPAQLLQLLLLADTYQAPKVKAAVLTALQAIPIAEWGWQTVLDVLDLPPCIAQQESCKTVTAAAAERVQQQLGDLDMVWADEQLQQQLLSLPYEALLQLLRDDRTCVASEHIVVYTILQWHMNQTPVNRNVAHLKQLMQQVRMQHCSQLYITTFMMQSDLVLECFEASELAVASLCGSAAAALKGHDLLKQYPAWTAPKRPASGQPQAIDWHLPLAELQQLFEKCMCMTDGTLTASQDNVMPQCEQTWRCCRQGQLLETLLHIQLQQLAAGEPLDNGASSNNPRLTLGVRLTLASLGEESKDSLFADCCKITLNVTAVTDKAGAPQTLDLGPTTNVFTRGWPVWEWCLCILIEDVSTWDDLVKALRAMHLVHDDNCLHLQVDLKSIE